MSKLEKITIDNNTYKIDELTILAGTDKLHEVIKYVRLRNKLMDKKIMRVMRNIVKTPEAISPIAPCEWCDELVGNNSEHPSEHARHHDDGSLKMRYHMHDDCFVDFMNDMRDSQAD